MVLFCPIGYSVKSAQPPYSRCCGKISDPELLVAIVKIISLKYSIKWQCLKTKNRQVTNVSDTSKLKDMVFPSQRCFIPLTSHMLGISKKLWIKFKIFSFQAFFILLRIRHETECLTAFPLFILMPLLPVGHYYKTLLMQWRPTSLRADEEGLIVYCIYFSHHHRMVEVGGTSEGHLVQPSSSSKAS